MTSASTPEGVALAEAARAKRAAAQEAAQIAALDAERGETRDLTPEVHDAAGGHDRTNHVATAFDDEAARKWLDELAIITKAMKKFKKRTAIQALEKLWGMCGFLNAGFPMTDFKELLKVSETNAYVRTLPEIWRLYLVGLGAEQRKHRIEVAKATLAKAKEDHKRAERGEDPIDPPLVPEHGMVKLQAAVDAAKKSSEDPDPNPTLAFMVQLVGATKDDKENDVETLGLEFCGAKWWKEIHTKHDLPLPTHEEMRAMFLGQYQEVYNEFRDEWHDVVPIDKETLRRWFNGGHYDGTRWVKYQWRHTDGTIFWKAYARACGYVETAKRFVKVGDDLVERFVPVLDENGLTIPLPCDARFQIDHIILVATERFKSRNLPSHLDHPENYAVHWKKINEDDTMKDMLADGVSFVKQYVHGYHAVRIIRESNAHRATEWSKGNTASEATLTSLLDIVLNEPSNTLVLNLRKKVLAKGLDKKGFYERKRYMPSDETIYCKSAQNQGPILLANRAERIRKMTAKGSEWQQQLSGGQSKEDLQRAREVKRAREAEKKRAREAKENVRKEEEADAKASQPSKPNGLKAMFKAQDEKAAKRAKVDEGETSATASAEEEEVEQDGAESDQEMLSDDDDAHTPPGSPPPAEEWMAAYPTEYRTQPGLPQTTEAFAKQKALDARGYARKYTIGTSNNATKCNALDPKTGSHCDRASTHPVGALKLRRCGKCGGGDGRSRRGVRGQCCPCEANGTQCWHGIGTTKKGMPMSGYCKTCKDGKCTPEYHASGKHFQQPPPTSSQSAAAKQK